MRQRKPRGFTIPEYMIVMTIMGVLSTVLLLMYHQSELALSRGMTLTGLEQSCRLAGARIIPKIASAVVRPADTTATPPQTAIAGILSPVAPTTGQAYTGMPSIDQPWELVLNSVEPYVQRQLRLPETAFNPRMPAFRQYRIFYAIDTTKNQSDPKVAPGGRIGNVWLAAFPADGTPNIRLSSNLHEVRFEREPDNVIRLTVVAKGMVKRAVGGLTLGERRYSTRVHLPIYTHTPGGT